MPKRTAKPTIAPDRVREFLNELFADHMHAKRVLSLGNAVVGAMGAIHAAALGVHAIGKASGGIMEANWPHGNISHPRSVIGRMVLDVEQIRVRFDKLRSVMDERMTRLWAAAEAQLR